jgi:polar amino acid transport system substrate-binding protein
MFTQETCRREAKRNLPGLAGGMTAIAVVTMGLAALSPKGAQAQEACSTYAVQAGDTLSRIASRGEVAGGFQTLFDANRNVLANPNRIEIGQVLSIPCADGSLPLTAASTSAATTTTAPVPTTAQPDRALRIVTASGYAPFTDEGLPGGGLITQMVDRSMKLGNPDQEFSLTFVNDWGAHLDTLLPTGAVDMVFPWFKPDCSKVANLSPSSAYRCTDFNHSAPFYEALVGYYTLKGGTYENVTTYAELRGARMCRPEAWFTFDLEAEGLMPPATEFTRPVAQDGCWQLLIDGEVDVITLDALPAEEDYRELGLADRVAKIEALTSAQTLHIFVAKDNQFANDALPIINAGLEELRLSGEWFNIVREAVKETVEN